MLIAVVFFMLLSLAIITSLASPLVREAKIAQDLAASEKSYYAAEAATEDAAYRVMNGLNYSGNYSLVGGDWTTNVMVTAAGNQRTITTTGDYANRIRKLETKLNIETVDLDFFYGVQVGDGGVMMDNNSQVTGNVYSNGDIVGVNANPGNTPLIMGDVIVAGGLNPSPSVEWTVNNSDFLFASTSASRDIAQSFIAMTAGPLSRLSVYLGKIGNPTSDLNVHITTDNGDKPRTTIPDGNGVIVASSVGATPSWVDVSFFTPPTLTNGLKYWIVLDHNSDSAVNYWNWRKDNTDGYAAGTPAATGKYTSSWSPGSPIWNNVFGDLAFRVWIGGVTTKIDGLTIGDATSGTGRANLFVDTEIHGADCPNEYCIVSNPARAELPIPDGMIEDWQTDATAGGVCALPDCDEDDNLVLEGNEALTIGPKQIDGDLVLKNFAVLTLSGVLWVKGDVKLSNDCAINLSPVYGGLSGLIVASGKITVSNHCTFAGSGEPGSYIMLLSNKDGLVGGVIGDVISVSNDSTGVIYYANKGRIRFSNHAVAKEATAYGLTLENDATITYESGLADLNFSSGPGGSFMISNWQETE